MNSMAQETTGELVVMQQPLQAVAIFSPGGVDEILAKLKAEVRAIPTDISTPAGRKQIASLAYKVARSKTALDDLGKDLVADWKEKAKKVDEDRRRIRAELDDLKDEVRKPLTDWENAEQARVAAHESAIAALTALSVFDTAEPLIALIETRLQAARKHARDWQEFSMRGAAAQTMAVTSLEDLLDRRVKQEAERAELARLKAEEEARLQREREEQIAREAADKAKREAEEAAAKAAQEAADRAAAEQRRVEAEKAAALKAAEDARLAAEKAAADKLAEEQAERARAEQEKRDAEARAAKAEADAKAAAEKAERDRIEAERLAAQRERESREKAEREKREAIEAERNRIAAEQERQRKETEARENDKKHRAAINNAALSQMISAISGAHSGDRDEAEDICRAIILAIAMGDIPHVKIIY